MKRATKMVALLLSAAMMVGLTACGGNAADDTAASSDTQETTASGDTATDDDMIYFAAVGPLTGTQADFGKHALWGAQVAVDEINAAGGILGKQVGIKSYDDENVAEKAAAAAEQAASEEAASEAAASEAAASEQADSEAAVEQALADYVKTYSSMKPKDAAAVFDGMMPDEMKLVVKILENMTAQQRSDILSKMNTQNASDITVEMDKELPQ